MEKWYIQPGAESDVVMSTRIRFARNLREEPFPARLNAQGKKEVCQRIKNAVMDSCSDFDYIEMENMSEAQAVSLAEMHLISPEFASERTGRALLLKKDESVSIMVNEEDHIRLQVLSPGLSFQEAYRQASEIDEKLDERLGFAFHQTLGYLTQCPTNLGTGMRASVMLHLPALQECGQIADLANTVSKLGLTIRGTYGEGTQASGAFYQLSNQVTLGISEEAALKNLEGITRQVMVQERRARTELLKNPVFLDKVWRAAGVLATARRLSSEEFMQMISLVRLGVAQNIFIISETDLNRLIVESQPATLMVHAHQELDASRRDSQRAALVREKLKNVVAG